MSIGGIRASCILLVTTVVAVVSCLNLLAQLMVDLTSRIHAIGLLLGLLCFSLQSNIKKALINQLCCGSNFCYSEFI